MAPLNPYTVAVARGVSEHAAHIDDLITSHLQGWTLDRLPAVDRAILRVAVWELLHADDVPEPVAVDEAVELAKELSTDESPGFVNGVLGQVMLVTPQIRAAARAVREGTVMSRLELRVSIAAFLAGTVVLGAVVCAAYGWTIVASAMSIFALGVGAWLYHCIERAGRGPSDQHGSNGGQAATAAATGDGRAHGLDAGRGEVAQRCHRSAGAHAGSFRCCGGWRARAVDGGWWTPTTTRWRADPLVLWVLIRGAGNSPAAHVSGTQWLLSHDENPVPHPSDRDSTRRRTTCTDHCAR